VHACMHARLHAWATHGHLPLLTPPLDGLPAQISFTYMQTPAVLTFLHMLSGAGGLAVACGYSKTFEDLQVNGNAVRGSAVRMVLYSTQVSNPVPERRPGHAILTTLCPLRFLGRDCAL
jgi:hypothetical protein